MNEINKLTSQAKKYTEPNSQILSGLRKLLVVMGFIIVITSVAMYAWSWNWKGFRDLLYGGDLSNPDLIIPLKANYIVAIKPITAAIIGMIPAGLYLLTSVALSVGVFRLSKHNTLVQDNYCIEMLARVNVLCLDKTGTITTGELTVDEVIPFGVDKEMIHDIMGTLVYAFTETNATSTALQAFFKETDTYSVTDSVPFSSRRKFMGIQTKDKCFLLGAPDYLTKDDEILKKAATYSNEGLRVLLLGSCQKLYKDAKEIEENIQNSRKEQKPERGFAIA